MTNRAGECFLRAIACGHSAAELAAERQIVFRMGIELGEVLQEGEELHGEGINIAVRIEGLAEAAEILRIIPNFSFQ